MDVKWDDDLKKLIKQFFVPILSSHPVMSITTRLFGYGIPIFMLHRITSQDEPTTGKLSASHLHDCFDYLVNNGYTFLSLEKLILALKHNNPPPPKSVVFTMDDGYLDQAEIASPIFLEYNCPVTFFVITGMLDQAIWPWDAQISWIIESSTSSSLESSSIIKSLGIKFDMDGNKRTLRQLIQKSLKKIDAEVIPDVLQRLADDVGLTIPNKPPSTYQPMTWDIARKLEDQGIRFAPHSVSHNILSRLSQKSVEQEIKQAWETISDELNNPLKVFCYPTGRSMDYGKREIEVIKNTGYLGAMSTTPDKIKFNANTGDRIYSLPRLALPYNMIDFTSVLVRS